MASIVFPYHNGDLQRAIAWLSWVIELGGCKGHEIYLMPAKIMGDWAELWDLAHEAFGQVEILPDAEGYDGWPVAPNSMIRQAAEHFWYGRLGAWTFMENDCIPTRTGWLDEWEEEYRKCGKPFMGRKVPANNGALEHMTGNAVYPQNTPELSEKIMLSMRMAFDVVAAPDIVPRMHDTPLIQHVFWYPEYGKVPEYPTRKEFEKLLDPRAVLFHRSKNGDVIRHLREMRKPKIHPEIARGIIEQADEGEKFMAEVAALRTDKSLTIPHGKIEVSEPERVKVYTYFREAVDKDLRAEQTLLLVLWEKKWKEAGFDPVILLEKDAKIHGKFHHWDSMFRKLPTVNPREYEMACMLRHVAMAAVGGGFLTDYDCLPNGITPEQVAGAFDKEEKLPRLLCFGVPCAIVGTRAQYEEFIIAILMADPVMERGKPHVSDMHVAQKLEKDKKMWSIDFCREWSAGITEKIIHFSHAACGKGKRAETAMKFFEERAGSEGGVRLIPNPEYKDAIPVEMVFNPGALKKPALTVGDAIEFLRNEAKKSNLGKGRIVKSLRAAGLIPKK